MAANKINSKKKGSRFERTICKWFQDWTGFEFSRVPASGGLRWKKTDNITSDITCTDPKHSRKIPFSIECKCYQEINFEHTLLGNKSCKIKAFWDQASTDAKRAGRIPLLIMKYNNMPKDEAFFVVDNTLTELINQSVSKEMQYMEIKTNDDFHVNIYLLSEVKDLLDYNTFYKLVRKSLKSK